MNSVGLKTKSLLTSLFIHLFIALVITAMVMKYQERTHETRVCVNLQALHYVEPKPLVKPVPKTISKPIVKKAPVVKKKITPIVKKKTVSVKKVAVVEEVLVIEKEIELTPVEVEKVKEVAVVEPVVEEVKQERVEAKAVITQQEEIVPIVHVTPEAAYMDENLAIINALIKRNLSYPRIAKKRGLQGKAMVLFTLDKEGNIVEISASGEVASILKKSALKTVKKASDDFPHPSQVLTLQIPIVYKLH